MVAATNLTKFYENHLKVVREYEVNYRTMQTIWTKEVLVLKFFSRILNTLNEFGKYFEVLEVSRDFLQSFNEFLTFDIAAMNCTNKNSSFKVSGEQYDANLRSHEKKLQNLTSNALNKVNNSLANASPQLKLPLQFLLNDLKGISTVDDYSTNVKWPRIPDTSGASYGTMKIRCCQEKKKSYTFTAKLAVQNKTRIQKELDDLKAASEITSKRKRNAVDPEEKLKVYRLDVNDLEMNMKVKEDNLKNPGVAQMTQIANAEDPDESLIINKIDSTDPDTKSNLLSRKIRADSSHILEVITAIGDIINHFNVYIGELTSATTAVEAFSKNFITEVCTASQDVFTSDSYLKTACRKQIQFTYLESVDFCESNEMKLYRVITYDDLIGSFEAFYGTFGLTATTGSYIDGYQASNGSWFVGDQLLYKPAWPKNSYGRCIHTSGNGVLTSKNCSTTYNALCEFVKTVPVVRVPVTTNCRNLTTIQDSNSVYVKSACIFHTPSTFDGTTAICRMHGMALFSIKTAEDYNTIKTFAANSYTTTESYFVDAKLVNGVWMTSSGPLYSGAVPASSLPCLIFRTNDTVSVVCNTNYRTLCEFV